MEQQTSSLVGPTGVISAAFYTQRLGFTLKHQQLPAFANVSLGDVDVLLSGPGASGSRPMPNGEHQAPGGWNRVVLRVVDLPSCIAELKSAGVILRNEMEAGPSDEGDRDARMWATEGLSGIRTAETPLRPSEGYWWLGLRRLSEVCIQISDIF